MPVTTVVGFQAGDEGKGKIIDHLAKDSDFVIRFQGGANAGHTIVVDGQRFISHVLPTGALHDSVQLGIGRGVVLDVLQLHNEVREIEKRTKIKVRPRLHIDEKTQILTPVHRILDMAQELGRGLGTTARGIGPAYEDEAGRRALYAFLLKDKSRFSAAIKEQCNRAEKIIKHVHNVNDRTFASFFDTLTEKEIKGNGELLKLGEKKASFDYHRFHRNGKFDTKAITDAVLGAGKEYVHCLTSISDKFHRAVKDKKSILLEGAQGRELDKRYGDQPNVTSSHTVAAEAALGVGCSPALFTKTVGVGKAYCTKVGKHRFVAEMEDGALSTKLREHEFGATTGRQRMVGWFDLVQARYSQILNGHTDLVITKLDLFSGAHQIKIVESYQVGAAVFKLPPTDPVDLEKATPVFKTMPGWDMDISEVRTYGDLPKEARDYLAFILKELNEISANPVKLSFVGVGPSREQIISVE